MKRIITWTLTIGLLCCTPAMAQSALQPVLGAAQAGQAQIGTLINSTLVDGVLAGTPLAGKVRAVPSLNTGGLALVGSNLGIGQTIGEQILAGQIPPPAALVYLQTAQGLVGGYVPALPTLPGL